MAKHLIPWLLAIIIGVLLLYLVEPYGPNQEHWDNPIYWQFAYPLTCIACIALGYFFPKNSWLYGILIVLIQALPAVITNPGSELIAVSIIALLFISVPPMLSGIFGAWMQKRFR